MLPTLLFYSTWGEVCSAQPRSSYKVNMPGKRTVSRITHIRCPNHLSLLLSCFAPSGRPNSLTLICKGWAPATLQRKLISATCVHHLILLVTTQRSGPQVRVGTVNRLVKSKSFTFQLRSLFVAFLLMPAPISLSISCSILTSHVLQRTPRYLQSFMWSSRLAAYPWGAIQPFFWQRCKRSVASELEVLTLITAGSHLAANRHGACWRSRSDEASSNQWTPSTEKYDFKVHCL